jgi:hypothetical protein
MLKAAIEKIESMAWKHIIEKDGRIYSDVHLTEVKPQPDRPEVAEFRSLDAIVQVITAEIERHTRPIFINVRSARTVEVFSTYREDFKRDSLYTAGITYRNRPEWYTYDEAMIALRSQFIPNEGTEYVLELLSSVSDKNEVSSSDNGITQSVNVRKGVSLQSKEAVRPRVMLMPYRTFLEVDQPESEFLLRLRPGNPDKGIEPQIGFFEADGGMWELAAKNSIAKYFEGRLAELIASKDVIVTR